MEGRNWVNNNGNMPIKTTILAWQ